MIKLLDRYLLKAFIINYVMSLLVLISLYIVLDLFVNLDEFLQDGQGVITVLVHIGDYYFYNLPLYFAQLSGVITLFAACGTLARMQRQNEVTAVLASGTSMFRLATPIVLAGLATNLLVLIDHEFVMPRVAHKIARERDDVEGRRLYQVWCARDGENRLLSAQQFAPAAGMIGGLIVLETAEASDEGKPLEAVTTAYKATYRPERKGWELVDGKRINCPTSGGVFDTTTTLDPEIVTFYPSELTPDDLLLRKKGEWLSFLSLSQLEQLKERGDANPVRVAKIRHGRFTMPISNVILLLLGLSFFMHRLPDSILTQGAKALGICGLAFVMTFVGQQLVGASDAIPLALPHWLPVFLFGPLAVLLLDNVKT